MFFKGDLEINFLIIFLIVMFGDEDDYYKNFNSIELKCFKVYNFV